MSQEAVKIEVVESARHGWDALGFVPLGERVVIEEFAAPDVSDGGIAIPDMAKKKPSMGTVVAFADAYTDPYVQKDRICDVLKLGDVVQVSKYGGEYIMMPGGKMYHLVAFKEIFGIWTGKIG